MPDPVTEKIQATRRPVRVPTTPTPEPPPLSPTPAPSSLAIAAQLARAKQHQEGEPLRAMQAFFASDIPLAEQGIPRVRKYAPEAEALINRWKALDDPHAYLASHGVRLPGPLQIAFDQTYAPVAGILSAPKRSQDALEEVRTLTPAQCRVAPQDAKIGCQVPPRFYALRDALHAVDVGEDLLRGNLDKFLHVLGRIEGWTRGELAKLTPAPQKTLLGRASAPTQD